MSGEFGEILLGSSTISQAIQLFAPKTISTPTLPAPPPVILPAPVVPTPITVNQPVPKSAKGLAPRFGNTIQNLTPTSSITIDNGKILPTKVYQNSIQPYFIPYSQLSSLQGVDVSTINQIVSSFINPVLTTSTILCEELDANKISLDNAILTANNVDLLLNGIPIATTSNISSLADWSFDPAISTVDINYNNVINVKNLSAVDLITNTLNVNQAFISDLTVFQQTTENFASTITIEARDIFCSSINVNDNVIADNGIFSTLTAEVLSSFSTVGTAGYFGNLTALTINGQPYAGGSNWAQFPASQAVSMNQNPLNGGSNFAINASNLTITGSNQISNVCSDYSVVADEGINIASPARVNLTAQNGTYGEVNITANGGFNNGINGAVNITANGSQIGGVGQGGSVNITANTPLGFSNLTSKISLSASGINSYAGVVPPLASAFGYNFVYGTNGVYIASGLPPGLPNTPGTTYIYGTTGIEMPSDAYMKNIYPYWDSITTPPDLNITGRYIVPNFAQVCVNLSNVDDIYMEEDRANSINNLKTVNMLSNAAINNVKNVSFQSNGGISGVQTISMPNGSISGVGTASIANITNLQTINGTPYPPVIPPTSVSPNLNLSTLAFPTTIQNVSSGIYFNNTNNRRNWIQETNFTTTQQNLGVFSDAYDVPGTRDTDWLKLRGLRLGQDGVSSFCKFERWGSNGFVLGSQNSNNTTTADYIQASNGAMNLLNVSSISGLLTLSNVSSIRGRGTVGTSNQYPQIFRYDYNPPTAVGGAEIAVSGKPQNAAAITTMCLGTDIQRGTGYLQSVWDGNILMPMDFYAANYSFQSDGDYCLFIDGKAGAPATLSTSHTFFMASTITQKNQHIVASNRQPFIQYGKVNVSGSSGNTTITLPTAYADTNYVATPIMEDNSPSQMSANITGTSSFVVYWANASGGSHQIAWTTFGNL